MKLFMNILTICFLMQPFAMGAEEIIEVKDTNVSQVEDVLDGLVESHQFGGEIALEDGRTAQLVVMEPGQTIKSLTNRLSMRSMTSAITGNKILWTYDPGYGYGSGMITVQNGNETFYLYCIEPFKAWPSGHSYSTELFANDGIKSILNFGFPSDQMGFQKKYNVSNQQAYVGTFIALNAYLGSYNRTTITRAGDPYVNALLSQAEIGFQELRISISKNNVSSRYNATQNRIESSEFISIGINRDSTRTFTLSGLPSGVYVINDKGAKINQLTFGQKFKLATDNLKYSGAVNFTIKHNFADMAALKFVQGNTNVQNLAGSLHKDPNKTFKFNQTFTPAVGSLSLNKKDADGRNVSGVEFQISANKSTMINTQTTPANGSIVVNNLVPGTYYYRETKTPAHIKINSAWKSFVITAGKTTSVAVTNQYKPVGTISLDKVIIDTAPAETGLNVEVYTKKTQNYELNTNTFKNTNVLIELYDKSKGTLIDSITSSYEQLQTLSVLKFKPNMLVNGDVKNISVKLSTKDSNKVEVSNTEIETLGYTSKKENIKRNTKQHGHDVRVEGVIRTQRVFGKPIEYWKEYITVNVPQLKEMRTGRAFPYPVQILYQNDLNQESIIIPQLTSDAKLIDGVGDEYLRTQTSITIPLSLKDGAYVPPQVYAEKDIISEVITESVFKNLSAIDKIKYRAGGHQLVTSMFEADLGSYPLVLQTNQIGTHMNSISIENTIETYAFLYGWIDENGPSPTMSEDEIVISPIFAADRNNDGIPDIWQDKMPDNWGVDVGGGKKVLRLEEKAFFGLLGEMTISYDLAGGTGEFNALEITEGEEYTISSNRPTKEGYIFQGWKNSENQKIYQPEDKLQILEDITLVAQWKLHTHTVTFDLANGYPYKIFQEVPHQGYITVPDKNPERDGYTFMGWSPQLDTPVIADRTHTAQWQIKSYDVTFDANGGTMFSSVNLYDGKMSVPGYLDDAHGINTKSLGTHFERTSDFIPITGEENLSLQFTFTQTSDYKWYALGFYDNNQNPIGARDNNHLQGTQNTTGHYERLIDVPAQARYIRISARFLHDTDRVSMRLYAKQVNTVTQNVTHGTKLNAPSIPSRPGYTFKGWEPNIELPVTSSRTYRAVWEQTRYTVTFDSNGGSVVPSQQVVEGQMPTTPTIPTRSGYRFDGWSPVLNTPVNQDRTHVAKWVQQTELIHRIYRSVGAQNTTSSTYGFGASEDFVLTKGQKYYFETSGYINAQAQKDGKVLASYLHDVDWMSGGSFINKISSVDSASWAHTNFTAPETKKYRVNNYMYPNGGSRAGQVRVNTNNLFLHAENATGSNTPTIWKKIDIGARYILPQPQITRPNHTFAGWKDHTTGIIHQPGATVIISSTNRIEFEAMWTPKK